jgi:Bacterial Ig domain/Cadherin-like domain/FecR protein
MAVASHIQDISNTDQSLSSQQAITATNVTNSAHSEAIGTIAAVVKGPVTAETSAGQTHALKEGDPIYLDETIITAVDSYVKMILNDGTVFQLGPQSRAHLDKYAYDPAVVGGEFESSVSTGTFRYISGKISGHNQGQHTLIKTPSAHIGIRGSEIDIQVDEQGSTTVVHLSGLISVTSPYHGGEQIVYEHGTTIHISSENTSAMMVNTLTEPQIEQINERWEVFGSTDYVIEEKLSQPENVNPNSSEPKPDSHSPSDSSTPTPDAGARNPFAAATKDVNAGESIDEPISGHEMLREYGQITGIAELSQMPSSSSGAVITTRLGTAGTTSRFDSGDFTTTGLTSETQAQRESVAQERLIGKTSTSFVEDEILSLKGDIIQVFPEEPPVLSNHVPITQSDSFVVNDNLSFSIPVATLLANDQDSDGDPLQIVAVTDPKSGAVQLVNETEIIFTPQIPFSQGSFNYLVSDGKATTLGEVIITQNHGPTTQNHVPITQSDSFVVNDNTPVSIPVATLLANDQDSDGEPLQIIAVTDPKSGTVQLVNETEIIFTPQIPFNQGSFNYLVSDGKATTPGEVIITHNLAPNLAPIAHDDQLIIRDLAPLTIDTSRLLANDSDPNADTLKIISVSQASLNGSVAFNQQGDIVFTPHSNFIEDGFGKFSYEVSDGHDKSASASVIITFESTEPNLLNRSPVPQNDSIEIHTLEPTKITVDQLLTNDSDPDHDNLSIISVHDGLNSQVTLNQASGEIVFTPTPTFNRSEQFTYEISDGHDHTAIATVTVTLKNLPPVANLDDQIEIHTLEPSKITTSQLLANDSDPDHDNLSIISVQDGLNSQVTLNQNSGEIVFTPTPTFNGSGQFTYEISDGHDHTATATVTVTLKNLPPVANPDGPFDMASQEQISLAIQEQLLKNDSDPNDDPLTLSHITESLNGTATLDGNGNVIFTRGTDFQGQGGFTYEITDGKGGLATAQVAITGSTILVNPDEGKTNKNQTLILPIAFLLANDLPQGKLTITAVNNAIHGEVQLDQANNQVVFKPELNFSGQARFDYVIANNQGVNATATVNIEVTNRGPIANPDLFDTVSNTPLLIANADLLKNDKDPDGDIDKLTVVSVAAINQSTVTLNGDHILFTPAKDFEGQAQFSYTITDTSGSPATIPVTVMVERLAREDHLDTTKNLSITVAAKDLLANDKDPNLTLTAVTPVEQGTVVRDADGNIVFTPAPNFVGEAQFQYSVTDVAGRTDSALVKVGVTNTPPVAQDDTATTTANQVLTIPITDLLANDQDADPGEKLTLIEVSSANQGAVELKTNEILFTPAENVTGEASFKYTITDTSDAQATATVNITVTPSPNLPPVITLPDSQTPLSYQVQNESLLIDKAATVSDPDSPNFADGTLEVVISPQRSPYDILEIQNQGSINVSSPSGGEITFNGTTIGSFFTIFSTHILVVKFNENANPDNTEALLQAIAYKNIAPTPLAETLTVKMTLSDGDGGTSEIVSRDIEITTTNTPPVAEDDSVSRPFNTPTTIAVTELLQNDKDINPTDILSISEITPINNGVQAKLVGNEIQLFIDALAAKHFEPVTLDYKVTDGNNGEDSATVTITPDNVIMGTSGDDNLAGTPKLDIVLGQAGDDTFNVSKGSDILLGGEGTDLFILDPTIANSVYINGDNGVNILSLGGTDNQILDLITNQRLPIDQQINLDNIGKIDLAGHSSGHNQLRLSIEDVLDLSDAQQLIVEGDATSMVNSVSQGWHNEGIDNTGLYNRYTHENAELLVSVDISNQFIS